MAFIYRQIKCKSTSYKMLIIICIYLLTVHSRIITKESFMLKQQSEQSQQDIIDFMENDTRIFTLPKLQRQKIYRRNSYSSHNLKRIQQWNWEIKDQYHHIYAQKSSSSFQNQKQKVKYGLKREAARDFCLNRKKSKDFTTKLMEQCGYTRGYSSYYATEMSPIHIDKKLLQSYHQVNEVKIDKKQQQKDRFKKRGYQYHNFAFLSESFKKMQQFIIKNIDQKIIPFTKLDMSYIVPILRHSQSNFPAQQYMTFKKIVRVTFDLGSVTVNIRTVMHLYRYVVYYLQQRRSNSQAKRFSGCFEENVFKSREQTKKKRKKQIKRPQVLQYKKLGQIYDQLIKNEG